MLLQKLHHKVLTAFDGAVFPNTPEERKMLKRFTYILFGGCFIAMLGIILYLVYAFVATSLSRGDHSWLLGIFSDFVEIMNAALSKSPYLVGDESYPAIAIIILYPFAWICRDVFAIYAVERELTVEELTARVILHGEFWVALILFFILCLGSILLLLMLIYKPRQQSAWKLCVALTCSAPFIYAIMRGNTIYFALIFVLLFLLLYEHPHPVAREIAYICLALAGAIKIYPLFFGVFLLKKKRIFPSVRVGIYFTVIFFVSFGLFADGIGDFFNNLGGFMTGNDRLLSLRNVSATSLLYKLFYLISPSVADSLFFTVFNWICLGVIFLVSTPLAIVTKSNFSRSMIVSAVILLVPSVTYFYVLIFLVIPLMDFLFHSEEFSPKKRRVYEILFLCLFFAPFIIAQCFIPHALIIVAMWITELVSVIKGEVLPYLETKKQERLAHKM